MPVLVALNKFDADTRAEIEFVIEHCKSGVEVALRSICQRWRWWTELASKLCELIKTTPAPISLYDETLSIKEKYLL